MCSLSLTYDELLRPSFVPVLMKHIYFLLIEIMAAARVGGPCFAALDKYGLLKATAMRPVMRSGLSEPMKGVPF